MHKLKALKIKSFAHTDAKERAWFEMVLSEADRQREEQRPLPMRGHSPADVHNAAVALRLYMFEHEDDEP